MHEGRMRLINNMRLQSLRYVCMGMAPKTAKCTCTCVKFSTRLLIGGRSYYFIPVKQAWRYLVQVEAWAKVVRINLHKQAATEVQNTLPRLELRRDRNFIPVLQLLAVLSMPSSIFYYSFDKLTQSRYSHRHCTMRFLFSGTKGKRRHPRLA